MTATTKSATLKVAVSDHPRISDYLQPENLLLDAKQENLKIADFGSCIECGDGIQSYICTCSPSFNRITAVNGTKIAT